MNLNREARKLRSLSIISIVSLSLGFLIIPLFIYIALIIILGVKILKIDWRDETLNKERNRWGALTLIGLGPITALIFAYKVFNVYPDDAFIIDRKSYEVIL